MSEREPLQPLSSSQKERLEAAVQSYEAAMTVEAARYLLGRGLTKETVLGARLGVVATDEFGHWVGRLAIPYLDREGKPLTIRFRCMRNHNCKEAGCPKYLPITGDPSRMFNIRAIHEATDEIHVTEGEFDAILLGQLGLHAVAMPGASSFQGHHRRMLAGFNRTYVWGDPDAAGAEFINKVCRQLRSAQGVRMRGGDVTETYLAGGPSAIYDLIRPQGES